jgi:RimJ/RimL family protein N-acetyltransferase
MFYHASQTEGIKQLEPRISNHNIPLIYFSKKRENVLVYLSNAVEKYCKETGFEYSGTWKKWGPYGFDRDGRFRLEEYYPDATIKTYKGVSGYIYHAEKIEDSGFQVQIPDAATSSLPVTVDGVEFVPDAYEAILEAERKGLITILRYDEMPEKMREWNCRTIMEEYEGAEDHPEYRHFLEGNFPEILARKSNHGVSLYKPQLEDLWFREEFMSDPDTMSYNHAWGGTIPFPKDRWESWYKDWVTEDDGKYFYRYLKNADGEFVGEAAYHIDGKSKMCMADVIVASKYRGRGYGKEGLLLLCKQAKASGMDFIYDDIAIDNTAVKLFLECGFTEEYRTDEIIMLKKKL